LLAWLPKSDIGFFAWRTILPPITSTDSH
jgi:hypothetical protein